MSILKFCVLSFMLVFISSNYACSVQKSIDFDVFLHDYYKSSEYKKHGFSKILYAIELGHKDIAVHLVSSGENLNKLTTKKNYSCLYAAVNKLDVSLVEYLLENGADPTIGLHNQKTIINHTLSFDCKESDALIEMFLEYGVNPNVYGLYDKTKPIFTAAKLGRKKAFFKLLEYGAEAVKNGSNGEITDNLLIETCKRVGPRPESDRLDILEYLVGIGVDVNYKSNALKISPLHISAQSGYKNIFLYLIQNKANINDQQMIGRKEVYKQTLLGSVVSGKGNEKERIEMIDFLIENKVGVNIKTFIKFNKRSQGMCPPIFKALYENKEELFQHLLASGAEINAYCECDESSQYNGFSPLLLAIEREDVSHVKDLLEYGAEPEYGKTSTDISPIDFAISKGNQEIIDILISAICDKYLH